MQDDIRAPQGRRDAVSAKAAVLPARKPIPADAPLVSDENVVDELKIEQQFGPAPDDPTLPKPKPSMVVNGKKIAMKLLPAMTLRPHGKRTKWLAIGGLIVLLLAGGASYAIARYYRVPVGKAPVIHVTPKPKPPALVPSTLTGLMVDPSVNQRPVTAVMIENSIDARPQSGLDQAGVVFEALAEGGVTRFMALYQDTQPDYLGPVRSARPYYIEWLLGFDAAYAHVGGSADALSDISAWGVKDLNQFYNAAAYHRISSRYAPHNVYTSIAELNQLEAAKGYTTSKFTGFVRKAKEEPSKAPTAISINIAFSGFYYDTHYDYDAATNTYKRSESGAAHMELHADGTQVQIAPKVLIAMVTPRQNGALDASGAYYSDYAAIGTGQIVVFQDGLVQTGTWSKPDRNTQISFLDANGAPLKLNPGQTWIAATPLAGNVTYK